MTRSIPSEVRWFGCSCLWWNHWLHRSSTTGLSGPSTLLSELPSSCHRAFSSSPPHCSAVEENECSTLTESEVTIILCSKIRIYENVCHLEFFLHGPADRVQCKPRGAGSQVRPPVDHSIVLLHLVRAGTGQGFIARPQRILMNGDRYLRVQKEMQERMSRFKHERGHLNLRENLAEQEVAEYWQARWKVRVFSC